MKLKKFLGILLCLVMMCSLLPMTALAEGETIITHVDIVNAPVLVAGQKVSSFTAQSATGGITISRPDGYEGFQIWDVTGGGVGVVNGSTVIQAGRTYSIRVFVKVNEGYLFPYNETVTATINGSTASVGYVADYVNSNHKYRSISLDITVPEPPVAAVTDVTVSPATATVEQTKTQQFTATVSGTGSFDDTVAWSVTGGNTSNTTITANGLLTVGEDETVGTVLTVTAVSAADATKSSSATVTVAAPAHVHSGTLVPAQEMNCTDDGWDAHYRCDCGNLFSDEACTSEITLTTTPADGTSHVYDNDEDPDCNKCGWPALLKFLPGSHNVTQDSTIDLSGDLEFIGTGKVNWYISDNTSSNTSISDTGLVTVGADEAVGNELTITAAWAENEACKDSITITVISAYAEGHGHRYSAQQFHDDTHHWQMCDDPSCDDPTGSIINKEAHKGGKATCTALAKCSVCGVEYGKKLPHQYGEWVVVKEPTETTYGKEKRTCAVCKGVHMEYIPPLGQNPATGDSNDVFVWGGVFAVSLLALIGAIVYFKKKK